MSLQIWVPGTADVGDRTVVRHEGRAVADRCRVCQEFVTYEGEPARIMEAHIVRCVKKHQEELEVARERAHPEIMKPWDTEFADWMTAHREAVLEGRKKP